MDDLYLIMKMNKALMYINGISNVCVTRHRYTTITYTFNIGDDKYRIQFTNEIQCDANLNLITNSELHLSYAKYHTTHITLYHAMVDMLNFIQLKYIHNNKKGDFFIKDLFLNDVYIQEVKYDMGNVEYYSSNDIYYSIFIPIIT